AHSLCGPLLGPPRKAHILYSGSVCQLFAYATGNGAGGVHSDCAVPRLGPRAFCPFHHAKCMIEASRSFRCRTGSRTPASPWGHLADEECCLCGLLRKGRASPEIKDRTPSDPLWRCLTERARGIPYPGGNLIALMTV